MMIDAERSKFIVKVAEFEKEAAIVKAEGESEAALVISRAMATSGDGLLQLRRIEAAKEISNTLSKTRNVAYLPKGGNILLNVAP